MDKEPLRQIQVSSHLRDQLTAAAGVHGPSFQAAMAAVDPAILQQLQQVVAAAGGAGGGGSPT